MNKLSITLMLFIIPFLLQCNNTTTAKGTDIKAENIIKQINNNSNVYYQGKKINGLLDFSQIKNRNIESTGIERAFIDVSITFINCTFNDEVNAFSKDKNIIRLSQFSKNVSFINCTFKKEINFTQSIIIGILNFNQSKFNENAIFTGMSLHASNNFLMETTFNKKALFTNIHVLGNINLMKSNFKQHFSLQHCRIFGKTLVGASNFEAYADFSSSQFMDLVDCKYAKFNKNAVFSYSTFKDNLKLADALFTGNLEIEKATFFEKLIVKNAKFSENSLISNSFFHKQSSNELIEIQKILKENTYFTN